MSIGFTLIVKVLKSHMVGKIRVIDEAKIVDMYLGDDSDNGITSRNLYPNNSLSNSTSYIVHLD